MSYLSVQMVMKLLAALVGLALSTAIFGQVVLADAEHKVSLSFERAAASGSIVETQKWIQGSSSRTLVTVYSEGGQPTKFTFTSTRGRSTIKTDAMIDMQGASVVTTTGNGASRSSQIPLLKRSNTADPSVIWFAKEKPEKGATVTFTSFDPERRYWEEVTVTFEGRGKLGGSPEGNLVTRKTARKTIQMVLDDKGLPLAWQENQLRLVRIQP